MDRKRARILKELRKLCFDHPGPVLAQDFVEDVKGTGAGFAPVPTATARPAARNKRKEIFGASGSPRQERHAKVRVPKTPNGPSPSAPPSQKPAAQSPAGDKVEKKTIRSMQEKKHTTWGSKLLVVDIAKAKLSNTTPPSSAKEHSEQRIGCFTETPRKPNEHAWVPPRLLPQPSLLDLLAASVQLDADNEIIADLAMSSVHSGHTQQVGVAWSANSEINQSTQRAGAVDIAGHNTGSTRSIACPAGTLANSPSTSQQRTPVTQSRDLGELKWEFSSAASGLELSSATSAFALQSSTASAANIKIKTKVHENKKRVDDPLALALSSPLAHAERNGGRTLKFVASPPLVRSGGRRGPL